MSLDHGSARILGIESVIKASQKGSVPGQSRTKYIFLLARLERRAAKGAGKNLRGWTTSNLSVTVPSLDTGMSFHT